MLSYSKLPKDKQASQSFKRAWSLKMEGYKRWLRKKGCRH